MKNLKGTKTEANLKAAFAGETQSNNEYRYFMEKARKEGHQNIANAFEELAGNEFEHGKMWYKILNNGIPDTKQNLMESIQEEQYQNTTMYPGFERQAREEGFEAIADLFRAVGTTEGHHADVLQKLLKELAEGKEFESDKEEEWKC